MDVKNKRGISPVVATVLLIVIAIALFLLIFLWLRGFQGEVITKQGTPIETVCQEISFDITISGNTLQIINTASIPIYKTKIYTTNADTEFITESETITPGNIVTITSGKLAGCKYVKVIPVLLGKAQDSSRREHVCENQAQTIPC